ncbi:MAG: EAL domain-containing protein [Dechloromonas sp.]|nr:EAL domain-containing protein [Dechloromonas sp.]
MDAPLLGLDNLSRDALLMVLLQSTEAMLVSDGDNRIVAINPAFCQLTGYTPEEIIGKNPRMFSSGRVAPSVHEAFWLALQNEGRWQGEMLDRRKDGSLYPIWLGVSVLRDPTGKIKNHIARFTDLGERNEARNQLAHLAYHDPLTHLPNRLAFESQFQQSIHSCERDARQVALMLIDLDQFKKVNDTLGHHVGDELLKSVALRLRDCVRASDIVARLGGDEFVVVLPDIESALMVASIAGKVQRSLADTSHNIGTHALYATPSIGISLFPSDGRDTETLLRNADAAMYHAKNAGRNNYQFYAASMNEAAGERLFMENALRQAVSSITPDNSQFSLHFQPQISLASGEIVGLEALARWTHPELGEIPPARFIPIAEETGLIQPLGDWVFWETCRNTRAFRDAGLTGFRLAVNISAQQLRHENLPFTVHGALACYDLLPSDIELEITESTAMQNPDLTISILNHFADMGIVLAIDDFGTGYSSLAYLKHLPIHRLKLDRSFVKDLETDANDAAICSATVALGHNLGLELVAEGVETTAQRDYLAKLGCDIMQGFLYSKPLPAARIVDFLLAYPSPSALN